MNIVEEAAKIIDPEAFSETAWIDGTTGKPHDFGDLERSRKEFHKAQAIHRAVMVLKLALVTPDLKKLLIEDETSRWAELGVPKQVLDAPEIRAILTNKYEQGT